MKYFDEVNKIWSGSPAVQIFNPNASLGQVILWSLQRNPNKIGQVRNFFIVFLVILELTIDYPQISDDTGAQVTNRELYTRSIRATENLANLGYGQGDVFGFLARNSQHLAPILFAALTLGCPINTMDLVSKEG